MTEQLSKESNLIRELKKDYNSRKRKIQIRLKEFGQLWDTGSEKDIFAELVFCVLTPQSKAKICWNAVKTLLTENEVLLKGNRKQILQELNGVRFKYKKSEYIIEARKLFMNDGKLNIKSKIQNLGVPEKARKWLVENIKGIGYKEASHFLRNIGLGSNLAILDRHILKNLKRLGVIKDIPQHITAKRYIELENKMKILSKKLRIPISQLDLLFWSNETGEIFK